MKLIGKFTSKVSVLLLTVALNIASAKILNNVFPKNDWLGHKVMKAIFSFIPKRANYHFVFYI